jgi:mono/diheme cytochrome c family protein
MMRGVATPALAALLLVGASAAVAQAPGFVPREETPEDFAVATGREQAFYACTACHNFKLVAAQGLSRAGWDETLTLMTERHKMPPLEGEERRTVLDYLASAYPPRTQRGWQNPFSGR